MLVLGQGFGWGFFGWLVGFWFCFGFWLWFFFLQNTILECWSNNSVKFIFIVVYPLK